ncbi:IucA/IucC family protein [Oceanospirillum sediminis]|uniref:Siderophore synthetase component n=1 Tax=Oceanospirillum sediminis TaxID=2760088 RepID=A0A839IKJ1_9GAMM|nr:IucA/IucC family protein [Oceanospirillum sediminis]MBB1485411.1 hypothetical protein [Oceanospirillum sediminis]
MNAINPATLNLLQSADTEISAALQQLRIQQAKDEASHSTQRTLLNCYIREVARPRQQITEQPDSTLLPTLPFGWCQRFKLAQWLQIGLPESQKQLILAVTRKTLMGNYRYFFPVLMRSVSGSGAAWKTLKAEELASVLIAEICLAEEVAFNQEFLQQILHSMHTKQGIMLSEQLYQAGMQSEQLLQESVSGRQQDLYLYSEQSLAYGHAFHPTPKCRQWDAGEGEARYAPEYRQSFQMHWFEVKDELLRVETIAPLQPDQLMSDIAPDTLQAEEGFTLVPVHPVQARYLLQLPVIQQALALEQIRDAGISGESYYPTASVRTLYNPDKPWFLKGSLNIRITNCVRKNAIYELESALALHKRLQGIEPDLKAYHQGFRLLGEPGFLTVTLPGLDASEDKAVQEGFGMVVRQNINTVLADGEDAVLAGALFQQGAPLAGVIDIPDKLAWLEAYAHALIHPMLAAYFNHGLIFEPHLQNTVICLKDNMPTGVIVRDFEGVKLVDQRWPEQELTDLTARACQSVHYSADQGWNRVRYCLFINNLMEAVSWLANDQAELEQALWQTVETVISAFLHKAKVSAPDPADLEYRLTALLAGEPLPGKTNLLVRISKSPDRAAGYAPVVSPFASGQSIMSSHSATSLSLNCQEVI